MKNFILLLSLFVMGSPAFAASVRIDRTVYCMETSYADYPAWTVNFEWTNSSKADANGYEINTRGYMPSLDDDFSIALTKKSTGRELDFPYGTYSGKTRQGRVFELLFYGLDMLNTEGPHLSYLARLTVGGMLVEELRCHFDE